MASFRPWIPNTDPETGNLCAVPGASEKVYWNGSPYPGAQKYVYVSTARNLPQRLLWDDEIVVAASAQDGRNEETTVSGAQVPDGEPEAAVYEEELPIAVAEGFLIDEPFPMGSMQPTYGEVSSNNYEDLQLAENCAQFYPPLPYLVSPPMFLQPLPPQQMVYMQPPQLHFRNNDPVEAVWQRLYQIYGTAMGILIKSFDFESQISGRNRNYLFEEMFFQEHNLPRPGTRELMTFCCNDTQFEGYIDRVIRGERRPRELRDLVKNGVSSGEWPGNTAFSELRNGFEAVRNKAKTFLTAYSAQFDAAWETWRSQRNNGHFR